MTLLGGAAAWPLSAQAQPEQTRRVGVLMSTGADDPELQLRLVALGQGLQQSGWTVGRNVLLDTRWASGDSTRLRRYTAELLALSPDVLVVGGRAEPVVRAAQQAGHAIPIVFVQAVDPVGAGYVTSLRKPGGNMTGFTQLEYTLSEMVGVA